MNFLIVLIQLKISLLGGGSLSSDQVETSIAFTPDEKVAYVSRRDGKWGSRSNPPSKIYKYVYQDNEWQFMGISSFSDENTNYSDSDIFISYDGSEAYFVSNRPYEGKTDSSPDIWRSKNENGRWLKPEPINEANSSGYEASPVTDENGDLYFSSMRDGGKGLGDFYKVSRTQDGGFENLVMLEGEINAKSGEWNLVVAPDASWIIFESSGREEGLSDYGDLFISFGTANGWSKPKSLDVLNSTGSDLNPRFLPKSNRLVFISSMSLENDKTDIFQIPIDKIEFFQ